jgi:two-component system, cell cycle response regulator
MKVLIAEPSKLGRRLMCEMLQSLGHAVEAVSDGALAIATLHNDQSIDVVMTALELQEVSGFAVCWEARLLANKQRPIYVIAISSSHDERKIVEALDSGADDFINKPPRPSELAARLRAAERLISAQRELVRLANYDTLTGLRNRRSFFDILSRTIETGIDMSVIAFDVDHFKRVNDTYGHDAGDDVLREIARRSGLIAETVARLGGEEFSVVVDGPLARASDIAERLRLAISGEPYETCAGPLLVAASFGVARRKPHGTVEVLLKEADVALYASKTSGRNRVTIAHQPECADALRLQEFAAGTESLRADDVLDPHIRREVRTLRIRRPKDERDDSVVHGRQAWLSGPNPTGC